MEEKIRLIWDFRGPDCEKTAKHYKIHLTEFLHTNNSVYFDFEDENSGDMDQDTYTIDVLTREEMELSNSHTNEKEEAVEEKISLKKRSQ